SLEELAALVEAAGGVVVGRTLQQRRTPDPNTWVGKGKVAEIAVEREALAANLVVCDEELSSTQQRKLEELCGVPVLDRSAVILDIFAKHARSKEGRLQVEVAQLEYRLPRLAGSRKGLSRLGGGIGTRGPGETKLESERQVIRTRLHELREKVREVAAQRERGRSSRASDGLFHAALVGYTNSGKSTLLNALAGSDVLVADQPFATLDPTTRRAALPNGTVVLLSDTVGFVHKMPPALVAAFRATLEELDDADLLVHVVYAAHPNLHERIAVVDETLATLGLGERERLLVLNKADALVGPGGAALREAVESALPEAVFVSARDGAGLDTLRTRLATAAASRWARVSVTIPHTAGALVQRIRERGALRSVTYVERGIEVEAEVPPGLLAELRAAVRVG
ncbi:MAG: GTPase HflX, partial [Candidatus Limnocylindria bacterium]|nr:GTPase HflX [Candidatus Limnocylindria bacterium]